jgi:chloramphenicol 3-O phosphotransferase
MTGKIIFLNGTSCSGKAEIARALQEQLEQPYFYFSIDQWLHMLPEKFMTSTDGELPPAQAQMMMEVFPLTMTALHRSIVNFMASGVNLIVDHVMQRRDWLNECVEMLDGSRVMFVGVFCEPEEVRRKESERTTPEGLGDSQVVSVHAHDLYDLKVDTCHMSVDEICGLIIQNQNQLSHPTAFQQLESLLASEE